MKFIVIWQNPITGERGAFETNYFDNEKFNPDLEMTVIDKTAHLVTFDGEVWQDIEKDNL